MPCGGGGSGMNYELSAGHVVQFERGSGMSGRVRYAYLYGWAISPEVKTVEGEFNNGEIVRAECKGKVYALVAANAEKIIRFRAYVDSGKILRQDSWPLTSP
jgi:hypothetical protein